MSVFQGRATGVAPKSIDTLQAKQALYLLADPSYSLELRGLPSGKSFVRPGTDIDELVQCASRLGDDRGIYYCLNPVRNGIGDRGARSADIVARRWLLIDVDPVKPEEHKDASATDAEHEAARETASRVHDWLAGQGWPAPVLVDSGNGWHLLYRIDLPNDKTSQAILRRLLYAIHRRFSGSGATIDRSVHNASRIAKLPGTWARKGPSTAERPHRLCRLAFMPAEQEVVSLGLLNAAGAEGEGAATPAPAPASSSPAASSVLTGYATSSGGAAAYARAALRNEQARVALATQGQRNNALNKAAYCLGGLIASGHLREAEAVEALREAANRAGLDVDPECGPRGIEATIRSGLEAGKAAPRQVPERNGTVAHGPAVSASAAVPAGESIIVWAKTIPPKQVEWLWPVRVPLGKLTTFAGQTGQGKTFVTCDIIARITRGDSWPDTGEVCEPGTALFISGDDDADDTIVPRLIELGADMDRVAFLVEKVQEKWTMAALETLDRAMQNMKAGMRPPPKVVVIDPPTSYLQGVDDHKNAELRAVLTPLKHWASRNRVAVILITHINKAGAGKVEAMARVMGSVAWITGVRCAHMFVADPEDSTRQLFIPLKSNLGPKGKGMAYRITGTDTCARVEWLGEVDLTADEAMGGKSNPRSMLATEWLIGLFRKQLEWPSEQFWASAREHNISKNAINEARVKLDMPKPRRLMTQGGDVTYIWWVPSNWPHLDQGIPPLG